MTDEGRVQTWALYGPLVEEGQQLLRGFTVAELERMRQHLDAIRNMTDRHRERLDGRE
jgi:hypothetical protein